MISDTEFPRLMIVGTVPYNRQSTSRAFDAYFHAWPHGKIAQVFSNPATPLKGHCDRLFQITDRMVLNRWLHKNAKVGKEYRRDELEDESAANARHSPGYARASSWMYRYGAKHTPLTHLLRKALWRKKYWNTPEFNRWLEDFNPECVFLSFSNDFFILEIALYIAEKFSIPICSSTGDDYYFDSKFSLNPLYYLYHESYKALNRKVFRHPGSAIYIGDKIRDKYNGHFGLDGETVYLVSDIQRRDFRPISKDKFIVRYFGNIQMGRNESICRIAEVLEEILPDVTVEVYSSETNSKYTSVFVGHKNIMFYGAIPYREVMEKTVDSDFIIVAEGTTTNDVNLSRYALSTKVADALASGCFIIGYGSIECGAIEYLKKIDCAIVAQDKESLKHQLLQFLDNTELQHSYYDKSADISHYNHSPMVSNEKVRRIIKRITQEKNETR